MITNNLEKRLKRQIIGKPHRFLAIAPLGFEQTLVRELQGYGLEFTDAQGAPAIAGDGKVEFTAKITEAWKAVAYSRIANRVLMHIADFKAENEVFGEIDLGNIIIAYETMQKEADVENITLQAHFCHLLTHGILHILGFDHIEDEEAEYMESFERAILQNLGIADPYKEEN